MPAKSRFLAFRGQRVHFRVAEPEAELKHRVFMLSSPLGSTFNWRKLLPELTQLGCMVVMMDLPGFGEGDCGPDISQRNDIRANMAWGVLDEVDREIGSELSLWHLIGHGSACQTILAMANEYPDSVRSQIHIAPGLEEALTPKPRRGVDRTRADEKWYDKNILNEEGFNRLFDALFARPAEDYVRDHMYLCLTRPGARESFVRMLRGGGLPDPLHQLGMNDTLNQETGRPPW